MFPSHGNSELRGRRSALHVIASESLDEGESGSGSFRKAAGDNWRRKACVGPINVSHFCEKSSVGPHSLTWLLSSSSGIHSDIGFAWQTECATCRRLGLTLLSTRSSRTLSLRDRKLIANSMRPLSN